MNITAYQLAERFIGVAEWKKANEHNPIILAMLQLDNSWPKEDEVPWCSGFTNYVAWLLRLPRSKSLVARSWLNVGEPVATEHAQIGWDVVILNRNGSPSPSVLTGPGHVGFYAGREGSKIAILGGNQSDSVSVALYSMVNVLGVRRLYRGG